jgi:hypothetical protein
MTASAKMPTTCWGRYGRVAVVRLEEGEVVALWDRQHIGSTTRCAFSRALAEAEAMCEELNS